MRKSQTSVEVIILMSFFLLILLLILSINLDLGSYFQTRSARDTLTSSLDAIVQSSEYVYAQGAGAQTELFITVPSIINSSIENNTITFVVLNSQSAYANVSRRVSFNVTGTVPNASGTYKLTIASLQSGVNISVQ